MQPTEKIQQVINILKEKGNTDEEIGNFVGDLYNSAAGQFYAQAILLFSEEDMKSLDSIQNQEEATAFIASNYEVRSGKKPDSEINKFIDTFAEGFLKEYEKEKQQLTHAS